MADPRVWTFDDLGNPPDPDPVQDTDLHVTTTKRHYELAWLDPATGTTWYPEASPANEKPWSEWLEFWGPLTEILPA